MTYRIEIICSGNNGRSPMAESIGNKEIMEKGLTRMLVTSSGTMVNEAEMTYERAAQILDRAAKSGFADQIAIDKTRYEKDADYRAAIGNQARNARDRMRLLEERLRDQALAEIGIIVGHTRRQFEPSNDVSLVLGMERCHADAARDAYALAGIGQCIFQISEYAGLDFEFPNPVGTADVEVYFGIRNKLKIVMPRVIERFRREHSF